MTDWTPRVTLGDLEQWGIGRYTLAHLETVLGLDPGDRVSTVRVLTLVERLGPTQLRLVFDRMILGGDPFMAALAAVWVRGACARMLRRSLTGTRDRSGLLLADVIDLYGRGMATSEQVRRAWRTATWADVSTPEYPIGWLEAIPGGSTLLANALRDTITAGNTDKGAAR